VTEKITLNLQYYIYTIDCTLSLKSDDQLTRQIVNK